MKPTDITNPEYFHKVVDCQHACPAHTPVPEYIRLIAAGKHDQAYMINWESNVFPGVLGRTCDRPCEPACRRNRIENNEEPVAICRLKRVAADNKSDTIKQYMPDIPKVKNGKRVALIGGGPASLTVARDLMPLGYHVTLFDNQKKGGGMMRSQIPSFRLPERVIDEEVGYITDMGVDTHYSTWVDSMRKILDEGFDAVFVGTGAPRGRDLNIEGRAEVKEGIHVGVNWLASVAFGHTKKIAKRVIVLGGGNTAMDCCRTAKRLGGHDVKVVVRSPRSAMKASPWEVEDTLHEDIPIIENHNPKRFLHKDGKVTGVVFELISQYDDVGGEVKLVPTGKEVTIECDEVLVAIGQDNYAPWIERDLGIEFNKWDVPVLNKLTHQSTLPKVFFGGDAAFGPANVITAVAQGHQAAISIDLFLQGKDLEKDRPSPFTNLVSQKMGIHEWSYDNDISGDDRYKVPHADKKVALKDIKFEVELGFDQQTAIEEAARCLNCDVQTVFEAPKCIECDACVDICPMDCITFTPNAEDEGALRAALTVPALNTTQDLYVSSELPTKRVMVKDEDVCLHCGLCAERCPTGAWDMQKYFYSTGKTAQFIKPEVWQDEAA